jgi:hypothetical protein
MSTASTSRLPSPCTATATATDQTGESGADERRAKPERRGADGIERHGREGTVESDQRGTARDGEDGRRDQVGVAHAEGVSEEELLQPLRRLGRERQQGAKAEHAGDHYPGGRLRADSLVAPGKRDQPGSDQHTAARAEQQRQAGQGSDHQSGQQPVRERLGRVAQPLGDDPEGERSADRPEERDLEQRPAADSGAQRVEEEVGELHGQCSWCWTVTARVGPPSSRTIISLP